MDEDMMTYVTENQEELKDAIWEVNCKGLSQNSKGEWSLAHPSIVKERDDKTTFNSLEEAKEIEEAAKSIV